MVTAPFSDLSEIHLLGASKASPVYMQHLAPKAEPRKPVTSMFASVAQPQTCESAAAPIPFTRTGQAEHTNLAHHTEHAASKARLILCALSEEHLKCLRTTAPESVIEVTLSTSTAMGIFHPAHQHCTSSINITKHTCCSCKYWPDGSE